MSNGYGRSAPAPITREQSIQLIVQACLDAGISNDRQIAYVLATAQHESQNFSALEESYGRSQATTKGYEGGEEYFGRGYVHLTHNFNYLDWPGFGGHPRMGSTLEVIHGNATFQCAVQA